MKISCRWLSIILCLLISLFGFLDEQPAIAQEESYKLGEDALQSGDYAQAIQYFSTHLQNGSIKENGQTLTRLGYAYSQLGRYAEAIRVYQDALRLYTSKGDSQQTHFVKAQALLGLGYIAYRQANFDDAIQFYVKVVEQGTAGVAEAYHNLGRIYAGRGEIEKAIDAQQQAIAKAPNFADAYYHLGVLYSRKQNWSGAITAYQKTVALVPTMPNAYYQLARCYRQTGDTLAAEKAMQRFRSLEKADADIQKHLEAVFSADTDEKAEMLLKLANAYLKYERYEEATREFKRVPKHSRSNIDIAQVSVGLGRIALEQGNITQAIAYYKHSIQLGLKTTEIYHYLGIAYMQNRDGQNAIKQFHQALVLNADFPASHLMLGTLYATNRKFEDAKKHYLRAIALAPEMAAAYHGLAYLYGQHDRNLEKAIELARKAIKLSSKSSPYHNTLSWLCYKAGKYSEAETAVLEAIKLAPDNPIYQEGLKEIRHHKK
ncbi:MAG: tetratricopeptide repeat protein [Candidatus Poribacteria bacterium]|nr:tetratricopeptide repeat protein [Candidatus Poribacteria bacterium]